MVLTEELAFRIERAGVAWSRAWVGAIDGLELAPVAPGHVLAACHPDRPDLDFQNRVNGLTPDDAALVPALVDWYADRGVRPWFELVPTDRADDLLAALATAGAVAIGHHGVVYGPPSSGTTIPQAAGVNVTVVDRTDDDAFATFARVRTAAHELPPEVAPQATADLRGWRTATGATLYLATVDGTPAATAVLTVDPDGGLAYLADGATLPAFRGRGLQSLLVRRRLHDAAAAGCDLACSQASVASTSHRNLQREGLTGGFTKLVLRVGTRGTQPQPRH